MLASNDVLSTDPGLECIDLVIRQRISLGDDRDQVDLGV